ncbi:MAG: hypothetical protein IPN95_10250 [Bacteroidetes bacterium]|nr:hypothetical protein [Bacteroidota bacterium]MBL0016983.1 hypothetical protein [Bacteroidota bacterium]
MRELRRLEKLIKMSKASLKKYEDAFAADENDFGSKLMAGNIRWHIKDLENQASELRSAIGQSSLRGDEGMAARAY